MLWASHTKSQLLLWLIGFSEDDKFMSKAVSDNQVFWKSKNWLLSVELELLFVAYIFILSSLGCSKCGCCRMQPLQFNSLVKIGSYNNINDNYDRPWEMAQLLKPWEMAVTVSDVGFKAHSHSEWRFRYKISGYIGFRYEMLHRCKMVPACLGLRNIVTSHHHNE